MIRQKKHAFSLLNNFRNSARGLREVTRNERPMQVEVASFFVFSAILCVLEMPFGYKLILFVSLFFPLFTELLNSAIERTVDLVTGDYHELAKAAKDAASAAVLISLIVTGLIWSGVLYIVYFGG